MGLLKGPRDLVCKVVSKSIFRITPLRGRITPSISLSAKSPAHLSRASAFGCRRLCNLRTD